MEKAFVNPRRPQSRAVDGEEVRVANKHQTLLQEYLQLQKEFVARKRKLQAAKQKRDTLFHEVRFLRRRHRYLWQSGSCELKVKEDVVNPQSLDVPKKIAAKKKKSVVKDAALASRTSLSKIEEMKAEERVQIGHVPTKAPQKKSRKLLSTGDERPSKKKISLHDRIQLKVV